MRPSRNMRPLSPIGPRGHNVHRYGPSYYLSSFENRPRQERYSVPFSAHSRTWEEHSGRFGPRNWSLHRSTEKYNNSVCSIDNGCKVRPTSLASSTVLPNVSFGSQSTVDTVKRPGYQGLSAGSNLTPISGFVSTSIPPPPLPFGVPDQIAPFSTSFVQSSVTSVRPPNVAPPFASNLISIPPPPLPPFHVPSVPPSCGVSQDQNVSCNPSQSCVDNVQSYLKCILESKTIPKHEHKNFSVYEMVENLKQFHFLLKKLETDVTKIENKVGLEENELSNICEEISRTKSEICAIEKKVNIDPDVLKFIKHRIEKRATKRKLRKKRKVNSAKIVEELMQNAREEHEKNEQMKAMRLEADAVLGGVLKKKSEASYYIQLLEALQKLYFARLKTKESQGLPADSTQVENTETYINKLKNIWGEMLKEYSVEETGLRLMLDESVGGTADKSEILGCAIKKPNSTKQTELRKVFRDWLLVFFGTTNQRKDVFYSNVEDFIRIRSDWDKYVVEDAESSKIPRGWVLPRKPGNKDWEKFIKK